MTQISTFSLPEASAAKASPQRIAADDARFTTIAAALRADIAAVEARLEAALAEQTGDAQGRVERDVNVGHFRRRLHGLHSFQLDAVLGWMTPADGSEPVYVGRLAVHDQDGRALLVDWRSAVAEPFFAATRAEPMGLASRRRYRWAGGLVRDYWDETLTETATADEGPAVPVDASPDEESALLASVNRARTPQMDSVLTTIAADQDAVIRADARRPLVVDGGPGTGKTVVALHRAAYLLYSDPRLRDRRGGVLFVGPHHPYLHYVADVLPSLGEDDVRTCTLADLVTEGPGALPETDLDVAQLKASRTMVEAIDRAVALYEEPPTAELMLSTDWGEVQIGEDDWADAFDAVDPGTPHNHARGQIWDELAEVVTAQLAQQHDEHPDPGQLHAVLGYDQDLAAIVERAWPMLEATDVLADLYEVPAYLARCAPSLAPDQVQLLRRERFRTWTEADLPLLDAARHRLGDPGADARRRRQEAARRETVEEVELMVRT